MQAWRSEEDWQRERHTQPRRKDNFLMAVCLFILGAVQFRSDLTPHFDDLAHLDAYDTGRDFAHRTTLRRFDA